MNKKISIPIIIIAFVGIASLFTAAATYCDINNDGKVNIKDIQICIRAIIGEEISEDADVNYDGSKNIKDVQEIIKVIINPNPVSQDSPFGLQAPFNDNNLSSVEAINILSDVGIKFVRLLPSELAENTNLLANKNIGVISGIASANYPNNMVAYKEKISGTVNDYKNYVKAWLVVNEADLMWKDTPEKYAEYFIITSQTIKSKDPNAVVVLCLAGSYEGVGASPKGLQFLDNALKNGVGEHFDVLDVHVQGDVANYKILDNIISDYGELFQKYGIQEKPIWMTEFGTHDGDPDDKEWRLAIPYQSEKTQAGGLVKKYIYGLYTGVEKMFWTTMTEWDHYNGNSEDYFSNVGLINHAGNDGQSHKKLSYYSYKKMVEVLEGSDWNNIQTIQELNDIYIYKFNKNGRSIWVAWNDNANSQTVSLNVGDIQAVKITEAIPKYESGKDVTDYNTAFNAEIKNVINNQVSITLGDKPVFVE